MITMTRDVLAGAALDVVAITLTVAVLHTVLRFRARSRRHRRRANKRFMSAYRAGYRARAGSPAALTDRPCPVKVVVRGDRR